jgi:hypothetical protein
VVLIIPMKQIIYEISAACLINTVFSVYRKEEKI